MPQNQRHHKVTQSARWLACLFGVFFLLAPGTSQAQAPNSQGIGEPCNSQAECITGLLCVKVTYPQAISVCLQACPTGQCLSGEACQTVGGKKVCMCDSNNPCKSGLPCLYGFCTGVLYCHPQKRPCPPNTPLTCVQPISGTPFGICFVKCKSDSECPPPGTRCIARGTDKLCYCSKDSDCKQGLICVDYHCHQKCTSDKDCPKSEYCTPASICEYRIPTPPEPSPEPSNEPPNESTTEARPEASFEPPNESTILEPPPTDAGSTDIQPERTSSESRTESGPEASFPEPDHTRTDNNREPTAETRREPTTRPERKFEQRPEIKAETKRDVSIPKEASEPANNDQPSQDDEPIDLKEPGVCGCQQPQTPVLWICLVLLAGVMRRSGRRDEESRQAL